MEENHLPWGKANSCRKTNNYLAHKMVHGLNLLVNLHKTLHPYFFIKMGDLF